MVWKIDVTDEARKQLKKIDKAEAKRILTYLKARVASEEDPRRYGKALSGDLGEFWRYRIGNYRVIASIEDQNITILVIRVAHRSKVYR
ncbi:type II toxin-antitoxin system RelE family toxin [Larsenimonas salina]|uniref:type II toxin-antitoxin system RelE family toxin n=1 Tax=Larsenimonas salina TaxID=1295565 RepID=UPI0020731AE5|nr:type II toxin-antitoxin system RelE/ParE family toxin [Larsenimonas salina]MCM5705820.1 type II toxin-antitoxin system RelE/ParE family toxin [Larsenimonas salina]